eukprot:SAG25_NODE_3_length_30426_cov_8.268210_23_plen_351_part_00
MPIPPSSVVKLHFGDFDLFFPSHHPLNTFVPQPHILQELCSCLTKLVHTSRARLVHQLICHWSKPSTRLRVYLFYPNFLSHVLLGLSFGPVIRTALFQCHEASAFCSGGRHARTGRVVAPASTPMAAQAPELPAGREPMLERWCYFCGRRGQPTRGSSRGRKRVAFVRCGHTQPGRGRGATAHDGSPSAKYFPGGRRLLPRTEDPERRARAERTPHWACEVCGGKNADLCREAEHQAAATSSQGGAGEQPRRGTMAGARTAAGGWSGLLLRDGFGCDDEEVEGTCALWLRLYLQELSIEDGLTLRRVCAGLRKAMDASEVFKGRLEFQMQMKNFGYRARHAAHRGRRTAL